MNLEQFDNKIIDLMSEYDHELNEREVRSLHREIKELYIEVTSED